LKLNRRSLLIGAASSALYAPTVWCMPGITLNPDPSGDDAPQINAALQTIRAAGRGWLMLEQLTNTGYFNIKDGLNATAMSYLDFRFGAGAFMFCNGFTRNVPMIDMTNSYWSGITGTNHIGGCIFGTGSNSPAGSVTPNCGVLMANGDSKRIKDFSTAGKFQAANVAIISAADCEIDGGGHGGYHDSSPTLIISQNADWGVVSAFATITPGPIADIRVKTRIHSFGNAPWAIYLHNTHSINFDALLVNGGINNRILAQGYVDHVTFNGGAAGAEVGHYPDAASSVLTCGSPDICTNLKFINFDPGGKPYINGNGNFSGYSVI
jgi:hypothetical protein